MLQLRRAPTAAVHGVAIVTCTLRASPADKPQMSTEVNTFLLDLDVSTTFTDSCEMARCLD